jgi:hypothetical protein
MTMKERLGASLVTNEQSFLWQVFMWQVLPPRLKTQLWQFLL